MSWLKDPLVAFFIAGAAIYGLAGFHQEDEISYRVEVRDADIQRLSDQWRMQMRQSPSESELQGLIDQWVKEEIYYREAKRLGLDANDIIVRRRMVQKLTFLTEDIVATEALDTAALKSYYQEHQQDYVIPPRYTFRHRYFSKDARDDAQADATDALAAPSVTGDPFMLQHEYTLRSEREIGDLFGRNFAAALGDLEVKAGWQGPVESAYGWHTVKLTAKLPESTQAFSSVIDRVQAEAQRAARQSANTAYFEALKSRYTISYAENITQ